MTRGQTSLVGTLVLVLASVAGCGVTGDADDGDDGGIASYVALGDSYTSATGVPTMDPTNGCMRSDHNYPALLAAELGIQHVDVSCGGAQTTALHEAQQLTGGANPPQLEAVEEGTDLVTVGLGLNDLGLSTSVLITCMLLTPTDPQGSPCRAAMATPDGDSLEAAVEEIGPRVEAALEAVTTRAPEARVVLIGYPQLVPRSGTCPELPLAAGDYAYVRNLLDELGEVMAAAADTTGADYVDLVAASDGHDVCAGEDAWVKGAGDDPARATAYHPFVEEQEVVAELVRELLT